MPLRPIFINGDHAEQFGRFRHYYGRQNRHLSDNGNPEHSSILSASSYRVHQPDQPGVNMNSVYI